MKNLKNLILALCASLLIFSTSCDKTEESTQVTLLTKITTTSNGTEYITTLEYDTQNKLIKYSESYDTNSNEIIITYNTDGKLSEYILLYNGQQAGKYTYIWEASTVTQLSWGKNENNTWVEGDSKNVYDINSEEQITKQQYFYKQDDNWISNSYDLLTWVNGNVEKYEMWNVENRKSNLINPLLKLHLQDITVSGLKSANDIKSGTMMYEYDNKNSAYLNMGFVLGTNGINKNNETKVTYSIEGREDQIFNITYEYNDKNYPTKRTFSYTNPESGEIQSSILFYEYTTK